MDSITNTDLALEKVIREEKIQNIDGTKLSTDERDSCTVTDIVIETEYAAKIIGKPIGRYITLEIKGMEYGDTPEGIENELSAELMKLIKMPLPKSVLVAGL